MSSGICEPDDSITQPQMSGQETECHLVDVKHEPDDTITMPQMSGQKTECHLVDMNSEPANQPYEINSAYDIHPDHIKTEPSLPISIPALVNVKNEATDRMITGDTIISSNAETAKIEPDDRSTCEESSQANDHTVLGLGKRYKCTECHMIFVMMAYLLSHMKAHSVTCSVCGLLCLTPGFLDVHMTHHKLYTCDICGKRYDKENDMTRHKMTHNGEHPKKGDMCGKRTIHTRSHTRENPYNCDVCGKRFKHQYIRGLIQKRNYVSVMCMVGGLSNKLIWSNI